MSYNNKLYFLLIFGLGLTMLSCYNKKNINYLTIPENIQKKSDSISLLVTKHFKSTDSFQKKSVEFLLENYKFHEFSNGSKEEIYVRMIDKCVGNKTMLKKELDSLKTQYYHLNSRKVFDASSISEKDLENNIELAFKVFNKVSWKNNVSLDNFCNYILPYRIDERRFDNWRGYFLDSFFRTHDSSIFKSDINSAVKLIYQWQLGWDSTFDCKWGKDNPNLPSGLPVTSIDKLSIGTCSEIADKQISVMRAFGIPATLDFSPLWLNCNSERHDWGTIILDSTHCTAINIREPGVYKREDFKVSKVFRKSFAPVQGNHLQLRGYCDFLPYYFNDPFLKDVTSFYTLTSNVSVPVNESIFNNIKFGYLAIYRHPIWMPIDWGKIENGKAYFNNLGRGGVYLPLSYTKEGQTSLGSPFSIQDNGSIHFYYPDTVNLRRVKLYRKYPMGEFKYKYLARMIGGKFQGANRSDFSDAVDMFIVKENPGAFYNTCSIKGGKKFRYVRYFSPKNGFCNVAEIEFYENLKNKKPLKGKVIGTTGSLNNNSGTTRRAAFDGNPITYFDSKEPNGSWVGLDLGKVKSISKIRFLARNDMNFIYKGNVYRLNYWDNGWKSLGIVTADTTFLVYKNVPENSLLLLQNITAGLEERIFTYENEEQVWW